MSRRGRPSSSERIQVEACAVIDIADIAPVEPAFTYDYGDIQNALLCDGLLPNATEERTAHLTLTWPDGQIQLLDLPLLITQPHFGGVRQWFQCPGCRRRVGRLFSLHPSSEFRCRHCFQLVYRSQYMSRNPHYQFLKQVGLI